MKDQGTMEGFTQNSFTCKTRIMIAPISMKTKATNREFSLAVDPIPKYPFSRSAICVIR